MITWPNGTRVAIGLAFDVDLELNWSEANRLDPGHLVHMSKGTYGAKQGLPRILKVLDTHDVKGTFFMPGLNAEVYPEAAKEIARRGHEIAYHGYHHFGIPDRTMEDDRKTLAQCEEIYMKLTGKRLVGYRSQGEGYAPFLQPLLVERGYKYMSIRADYDRPYICIENGEKIPLAELTSDVFYDDSAYDYYIDSPPARYGIKTAKEQFQIWADEFDALRQEGGRIANFVIHPQFIGKASRINMLGDLIAYMKERGGWIATNEEIADHVLRENGFEPEAQIWK